MKIGIPQSNFHCESHSQTGVSLFAIRSHHCCNSSKGRRKNVVRSKRKIHSISCCALKSRKKPFRGHFRCYLTNVKLDSFLSQLQWNFRNTAKKKKVASVRNDQLTTLLFTFSWFLLHKRVSFETTTLLFRPWKAWWAMRSPMQNANLHN